MSPSLPSLTSALRQSRLGSLGKEEEQLNAGSFPGISLPSAEASLLGAKPSPAQAAVVMKDPWAVLEVAKWSLNVMRVLMVSGHRRNPLFRV